MSPCRDQGFYSPSSRAPLWATQTRMVSVRFPAAARMPTPRLLPSQCLPTSPLTPRFIMAGEDGCGGAGSSSRERAREDALHSWRMAVHLWLPKREELGKTGTKARQLHP